MREERLRGFIDVEMRETLEEEDLRVLLNLCEMVNPDDQPKIWTALSIIRTAAFHRDFLQFPASMAVIPSLANQFRPKVLTFA